MPKPARPSAITKAAVRCTSRHSIPGRQRSIAASLQRLRAVAKLVDEGQLKPHVSRFFALDELAEAYRFQESGHVTGKIVVRVKEKP